LKFEIVVSIPPTVIKQEQFDAAKDAEGDGTLQASFAVFICAVSESVSEKGADGVRVNDWETIPARTACLWNCHGPVARV
jgi:hypothetical protein